MSWTCVGTLSGEEAEHAKCLGLLKQKVEEGVVHIKANRFNETAIQTSVDYVRRLLDEVDEPETDLIKALSLAEYIEESLLENKYFEIFEDDGVEIHRTLDLLSDATKGHLAKVRKELAKAEGRDI